MNRWLNISRIGRLAVVVLLVSLVGCVQPASEEYVRVEGFGIGTTYRIIARAKSGSVPEIKGAAEAVFEEMTASMRLGAFRLA